MYFYNFELQKGNQNYEKCNILLYKMSFCQFTKYIVLLQACYVTATKNKTPLQDANLKKSFHPKSVEPA